MGAAQSNRNQEKRDKRQQKSFSSDVIWVSDKLTDEQKREFDKWLETKQGTLEAELATTIEEGYRISVSWDAYSECFQCTLFTRDDTSQNYGKMLVSRSADWYRSVLMCMFKHVFLYEGIWRVTERQHEDNEG